MLTFKQAFDRITTEYIKGNMFPYQDCACFVGNLLQGDEWSSIPRCVYDPFNRSSFSKPDEINQSTLFIQKASEKTYTDFDIAWLEHKFMTTYEKAYNSILPNGPAPCKASPINEDALFIAMEKTLDELKKIHITLGQDIEETVFTKRQLQTA